MFSSIAAQRLNTKIIGGSMINSTAVKELESINGGWSPQGFAISFVLGGAVGVGVYSIYQFGMDQGYRNNKK